jgi:prepilin-type N-terminal cleavage/methylation domain-containing protein
MKNIFKARKSGFTLVELLIVTVIIGILAGMMMLMMGSATDGAEATKLINDLRLVKSAALLYYLDYEEWPEYGDSGPGLSGASTQTAIKDIAKRSLEKYMDKPFSGNYDGNLYVAVDTSVTPNQVYYGLSPDKISPGATAKLGRGDVIFGWNAGPKSYDGKAAFVIVR